jgi:hypothetical protein
VQVTALIGPVRRCTYQVPPLGRNNRGLTWADICWPSRSSVDSGYNRVRHGPILTDTV